MRYTTKDLKEIANTPHSYIFEFWDKMIVIGYLIEKNGIFYIANIAQNGNWIVRPGDLNRIISKFTFRIYKSKKFKEIDIFEFNNLVKKANCEVI